MKKWRITIMTGMAFLLTACGGFDPETALNDSREQLTAFFTSHEDKEIVADYTQESVLTFLEGDLSEYFSDNFKEEISGLVEKIPFEETTLDPIPNKIDFLDDSNNQILWTKYVIDDYEIDSDNKQVIFEVSSEEFGMHSNDLKITMYQDNGNWKIFSISE